MYYNLSASGELTQWHFVYHLIPYHQLSPKLHKCMSTDEFIPQALLGQTKNINDLIGQEMSLWAWAMWIQQNPEAEDLLDTIFQKVYQTTAQNLENLVLDLLSNQPEQFNHVDLGAIKQKIQLFVNQLVIEKKQEFAEKLQWVKKNMQ
jgi:GTPase SAR1 family protein